MKRMYLLWLLSLAGCQGLLDKEPQNRLSVEQTFQDIESATVTLNGAYRSLLETNYYNGNRMLYPELTGGNAKVVNLSSGILLDAYGFQADPVAGGMNSTYTHLYAILNNLNNIILRAPLLPNGTEAARTRLVAEAKALRALIHFDLVQLFAQPYAFTADASHPGVIINLKPIEVAESQRPRSSVSECYRLILSDLAESLELLPATTPVFTGNQRNYLSVNAVKALLARVYLSKGDWQRAYQYANEVINSGSYTLYSNADYTKVWTQRLTSESIFEIGIPTNFSGTSLGSYFDVAASENRYLQMAATTDVLRLFSSTDVRGTLYASKTLSGTSYPFSLKYPRGAAESTPVKVIRLSELVLIRAEAAAELGNVSQANTDLTTIRKRADLQAETSTYTSKSTLIEQILLERRKELCFEGFLLFDLARRQRNIVRTDCSSTRCSLPYPSAFYALPLPATTVLVNPTLQQNPGY